MASGVVAIRNLKTDKVYLFFADDIQKENVLQRFKLDMGMHPCRELQEDYTDTGLEVFRFETVKETDNPDDLKKVSEDFVNIYK